MQKHILTDVAVLRPILILLLVFYHAFAVYSGGWAPIEDFPEVKVYWWLDKLSYAFMLETFVFVSGYVFGYQVRTKGEVKLELKNLLWSKFKRLLVPCMVFGFLYIVLFNDIHQPVVETLYDVVNGVGHLWFLPMLFWCFVGIWLVEKMRFKTSLMIPILFVCSLCSFIPFPLQLKVTMYYMFFFYIGYILQRKKNNVEKFYQLRYVICLAIAFIVLFPVLTLFRIYINDLLQTMVGRCNLLIFNILELVLARASRFAFSSIGLAMLVSWVGYVNRKWTSPLPQWVLNIECYTMGVYLFQQFILKGLYYFTAIPSLLGPYWLPWVGFAITLLGSLLLTHFLRQTDVGRFLIG